MIMIFWFVLQSHSSLISCVSFVHPPSDDVFGASFRLDTVLCYTTRCTSISHYIHYDLDMWKDERMRECV